MMDRKADLWRRVHWRSGILASLLGAGLAAVLSLGIAQADGLARAGQAQARVASHAETDLQDALPVARRFRLRAPRYAYAGDGGARWRLYRHYGYGAAPLGPRFYASAQLSWMMSPRDVRQLRRQQRGPIFVQFNGGGRWGWRGGGRAMRRGMEAPDAARELRRQGYSNIDPLTRRGGNYVGEATAPRGGRQRVIIDAGSGRVTGASPLGPQGPVPPPGGGWYGGY